MSQVVDIKELNEKKSSKKSAFVQTLVAGMNKVIVGQKHLVESLLIGLLSDGHILLEGVPGLAKTLAIKTLAQLIDADYSRIQFTPPTFCLPMLLEQWFTANVTRSFWLNMDLFCQFCTCRRNQPSTCKGAERSAGGDAGTPSNNR